MYIFFVPNFIFLESGDLILFVGFYIYQLLKLLIITQQRFDEIKHMLSYLLDLVRTLLHSNCAWRRDAWKRFCGRLKTKKNHYSNSICYDLISSMPKCYRYRLTQIGAINFFSYVQNKSTINTYTTCAKRSLHY